MKRINVGYNKGGTTKTTTALHLALFQAEKKERVLLIDVDTQLDLSRIFCDAGNFKGFSSARLFDSDLSADEIEVQKAEGWIDRNDEQMELYYIPGAELPLAEVNMSKDRRRLIDAFKRSIDLIEEKYDFDTVIFDTPPTLSIVQLAGLSAATGCLMPVSPDPNGCGAEKTKKYTSYVKAAQVNFGSKIRSAVMVVARVNGRSPKHLEYVEWAKKKYGSLLVSKYIEETTAMQNAVMAQRPIWSKQTSNSNDRVRGATYVRVMNEIVSKLGI